MTGIKSFNKINVKVYVMYTNGFIKVGVSSNPEKRLRNVQTGCPTKVILLAESDDFARSAAEKIEGIVHKELEGKHSHGEWFEVSLSDIVSIVETDYFAMSLKVHEEALTTAKKELSKHEVLIREINTAKKSAKLYYDLWVGEYQKSYVRQKKMRDHIRQIQLVVCQRYSRNVRDFIENISYNESYNLVKLIKKWRDVEPIIEVIAAEKPTT